MDHKNFQIAFTISIVSLNSIGFMFFVLTFNPSLCLSISPSTTEPRKKATFDAYQEQIQINLMQWY